MPENNFVQFNSSLNNMMSDDTYIQQAPQGIVGGGVQLLIAPYTTNYSIS